MRTRLILMLALLLTGCSHGTRVLRAEPPHTHDVADLLAAAPLAPGENIRPTLIAQGENASLFLIQIRKREVPHTHTRYDLTVVLVRGAGKLWLNGRPLPMKRGDAAFIPRGTPHFFVNEGAEPAAALVGFAPRFEGPDQAPAVSP